MAHKSAIEWTERTWNPLAGCTAKSPGCVNCYAATMSARLEKMGQEKYTGVTIEKGKRKVFNGLINYDKKALIAPLSIRKPDTFFVNSMSDLFWGDEDDLATARRLGVADPQPVPFEFIDKVFAVMALTPQHTYQCLTKRPARMLEYFSDRDWRGDRIGDAAAQFDNRFTAEGGRNINLEEPLPNIWLGVSVEDQKTADERIPILLETPAAVRWLSIEPLLGPVDLTSIRFPNELGNLEDWNALDRCVMTNGVNDPTLVGVNDPIIDWLVVGGESGSNARSMHPDWVRSIRDQCTAAGVAFFFKQWGEWLPYGEVSPEVGNPREGDGIWKEFHSDSPTNRYDRLLTRKLGKKRAGRLLDGREWNEMPEVSCATNV